MSLEGHREALQRRHQQLEAEIGEETKRPQPDDLKIQTLKKRKLAIKTELSEIGAN